MCGIYAAATSRGRRLGVTRRDAERMRDLLARRGPDGAGVWESADGRVILAHRRLAVIDPSESGAQPMSWPRGATARDARWTISYNGEVYNDAEVRRELAHAGVAFRTSCDTETFLAALAVWGTEAFARIRGMFAVVAYDAANDRVIAARDALGIKPVYWAISGDGTVILASEPAPIVRSPGMRAAPNWRMVSAYISTIRTVMGTETMFAGVHAVRPGSWMEFDLRGDRARAVEHVWWRGPRETEVDADAVAVRAEIERSVTAHLRADVPTCFLVSGGLDSTIIAKSAARECPSMRTYGAGPAVDDDEDPGNSDLVFAARVSTELGARHAEAVITADEFRARWTWMVGELGVPLSTPNEVAIWRIASRLREDGCIVTMSGEGADELFGGYDAPLARVAAMRAGAGERVSVEAAALMELVSTAWAPPGVKDRIVSPEFWRGVDQDGWMIGTYVKAMRASIEDAGHDDLGAHLRMHRRMNLVGLLQRLDTATMLAGVEGRTPFADVVIAELAERLPVSAKIALGEDPVARGGAGGAAVAVGARTKIVLREAFTEIVPAYVMDRPKRSFPIPFRRWVGAMTNAAAESPIVREVYRSEVIDEAVRTPEAVWHIAWPMVNLALWGEQWWGSRPA